MTRDVPFTVSPAAEAHLRELLRLVADTVPEANDLVPALGRGSSRTTWAWRGASPMPEYSDEEFSVRYYRAEQVAGWPRVRVAGADLAVSPETLDRLRGLNLELNGARDGEPLSGQVVGRRY